MLKHIGRLQSNNAKVLVAFRTLPGESDQCLVIPVSVLPDSYHDSIMKLVETPQAQDAFEFGEILFIRNFPDGRPMLNALKADGILQKVPTTNVLIAPDTKNTIALNDLNVLIAEQRNCAVDDLYTFVSGAPRKSTTIVEDIVKVKDLMAEPSKTDAAPLKADENTVLDDATIAKNYRSQADALYKEAARLRQEAENLDPKPKPKRTTRSKTTEKSES